MRDDHSMKKSTAASFPRSFFSRQGSIPNRAPTKHDIQPTLLLDLGGFDSN